MFFHINILVIFTRYTVRGRGAKHFFPSGRNHWPSAVTTLENVIRGKLAKRCRTRADLEEHCFCPHLAKKLQTAAEKGSLNRPIPLLIFINCDPLSDHSKSKAQTTKVQQPRPCLQIPFAKSNYEWEKKRRRSSRTSVFLHYRTERALRAKIYLKLCTKQ